MLIAGTVAAEVEGPIVTAACSWASPYCQRVLKAETRTKHRERRHASC